MTIRAFDYATQPVDISFGSGALAQLGRHVHSLGIRRLMVLSTPGQAHLADRIAAQIGDTAVTVFSGARMHVPKDVVDAAADSYREAAADGVLAIGGGSTIGLAKALALRFPVPIIALPTTYAGSEMTSIWGITEDGVKRTGRDRAVLPAKVVYDPELTLKLPTATSVTSAINALAHAVEALWAPDRNPVISLMAEEGVRAIAGALPRLAADPEELQVRSELLYGAWLCGTCLGATTMSLHHKLCHVLGGSFDLPHAETHAIVLPYVLEYNGPEAPEALAALSRALGDDPIRRLISLRREASVPSALRDLGLARDDLDRIVDAVIAQPYANPRTVTADDLRALLERAWQGALG